MLKKTSNVLILAFLSHVAMSAPCLGKRKLETRKMPAVSGWVATWGEPKLELNQYYDEVTYSFVDVTNQHIANWTIDGDLTAKFTGDNSAEDSNPPVLLSIGGWSMSKYFSGAVNETYRKQFVNSIVDLVVPRFSGVDLDWEFPNAVTENPTKYTGTLGLPCNEYSKADTANYLQFIKELRVSLTDRMQAAGKRYAPILSAAVPISGFLGPDDKPLSDTSEVKASDFVNEDALDFISIMSYDVGGFFNETTGINQPWEAPGKEWSMKRSLDYWTGEAKVPADKIQMGLPAYGKVMTVDAPSGTAFADDGAYHKQIQPKEFDKASNGTGYQALLANPFSQVEWNVDRTCGIIIEARQSPTFAEMVTANYITDSTDAKTGDNTPGDGWKYYWDDKALAPYLLNSSPVSSLNAEMVTYDSIRSFREKSKKLAEYKDADGISLLGVKIWHVAGDTTGGDLVKAVREIWPKA